MIVIDATGSIKAIIAIDDPVCPTMVSRADNIPSLALRSTNGWEFRCAMTLGSGERLVGNARQDVRDDLFCFIPTVQFSSSFG